MLFHDHLMQAHNIFLDKSHLAMILHDHLIQAHNIFLDHLAMLLHNHLVHAHNMLLEVALQRSPEGALGAAEGLLPRVHQKVPLEVGAAQEPLATHRARVAARGVLGWWFY